MIEACEFEEMVWETERIRIVIRSGASNEVQEYPYVRAANEAWTIHRLIRDRIQPCIGENTEVVVIQGDGKQPRGMVRLYTVRNSYA